LNISNILEKYENTGLSYGGAERTRPKVL